MNTHTLPRRGRSLRDHAPCGSYRISGALTTGEEDVFPHDEAAYNALALSVRESHLN